VVSGVGGRDVGGVRVKVIGIVSASSAVSGCGGKKQKAAGDLIPAASRSFCAR
jgi:hypothetical protein